MRLKGLEIPRRGSNHKYDSLDNLDLLYELVKEKGIAGASKELSVPYNTIRYRILRYFPQEWIDSIKRDRIRSVEGENSLWN